MQTSKSAPILREIILLNVKEVQYSTYRTFSVRNQMHCPTAQNAIPNSSTIREAINSAASNLELHSPTNPGQYGTSSTRPFTIHRCGVRMLWLTFISPKDTYLFLTSEAKGNKIQEWRIIGLQSCKMILAYTRLSVPFGFSL